MNLPNKLTVLRIILTPVYLFIFLADFIPYNHLFALIVFILAAITDAADGKIARKYGLVTDFGKFIDPLADKFMVIGSQITMLVWMLLNGENTLALVFVWVVLVILLRELGVTSIRLVVAGKSGIVVAASMLGKLKTVSQMVGTVVILVEPLIPYFSENHILSYVFMAIMIFTTIFSGIDYLRAYMPYIDSNK